MHIPGANYLATSGAAMQDWLEHTRSDDIVLSLGVWQKMMDLCQVHLLNSQKAGIHEVPKHHFCRDEPHSPQTRQPQVSCYLD